MSLKLILALYGALFLLAGQPWQVAGVASRSPHSHSTITRPTPAAAATAAKSRKPRLVLRRKSTVAPARSTAPRMRLTSPAAGTRIAVFNGLNQPGLRDTDNVGFSEAPPDTTGSIGLNHYVEMVNSVIGVYKRSDLSLVTSAAFNTWLGQIPSIGLCDPQMQWDPSSQRWLYVVLECPTSTGIFFDKFLFGWSKTSDPSDLVSGWCNFSQSTPNFLSDYPKLGHNSNYMIVGTNDFSDLGMNPFITAEIWWMHTPVIGDTSCTQPAVNSKGSAGTPLKNGNGTLAVTPVPVNTTSNAPNGYVLAAYDPSGPPPTNQTKLAVSHLDSAGNLTQDSDLTVSSYTVPSPAPDLNGSNFKLDTLDGRLTQAVGDPTTGIYTQHTVNGTGGRSKVTWYEIQVASSVPALTQEGDIASTTDFVFNGAISPRADGAGAIIFYNRSSASTDPVIASVGRMNSTPKGKMDPGEIVLATSSAGDNDFTCGSSGFPCRWGDYSGASPDPLNTNVVWGSNQALTSPSTGTPNWVTENYAIVGPSLRAPVSQSSPAPTPSRDPANRASPAPPGGR